MTKVRGQVGFAVYEEIPQNSGIFESTIIERNYYGNMLRKNLRYDQSTYLNKNISIGEDVSILADPFAMENLGRIVYFTLHGVKWEVKSIDIQSPRLVLRLGGVYNDQQ